MWDGGRIRGCGCAENVRIDGQTDFRRVLVTDELVWEQFKAGARENLLFSRNIPPERTVEQLFVRTMLRRKIARRQRGSIATATAPNQCWNMDFVRDKLADGRSFRILTVVDQFTRECVCLAADRAMTGMTVAQALERAKVERGKLPTGSPWTTEPSFAVVPWKPG